MASLDFDKAKNGFRKMTIIIKGREYDGLYSDIRVVKSTIPSPLNGYDIRHEDDDDMSPVSIKKGNIMVNCYGTFITEHISGLDDMQVELDIDDYDFPDEDSDDVEFVVDRDLTDINNALRKYILENGTEFYDADDVEGEHTIRLSQGIYLKGYDTMFWRVVADSDPDWDEVVLRDVDFDVQLSFLNDDEIRTLISNITGFKYDY